LKEPKFIARLVVYDAKESIASVNVFAGADTPDKALFRLAGKLRDAAAMTDSALALLGSVVATTARRKADK
jgi:hypothetical protein